MTSLASKWLFAVSAFSGAMALACVRIGNCAPWAIEAWLAGAVAAFDLAIIAVGVALVRADSGE